MLGQTSVEDRADYVLALSLEVDGFAQTASDYFAKKLVLYSIVKEN
jgi:hypothetical protein